MRKIVENSMLGKAWVVSDNNNLNIDVNDTENLVKNILKSRGIEDETEILRFLHPSIKEYMPDPFVLKDMDVATRLIADAVCGHKKIAVYGDYDVDGITSTAIFVKYLLHIPEKERTLQLRGLSPQRRTPRQFHGRPRYDDPGQGRRRRRHERQRTAR